MIAVAFGSAQAVALVIPLAYTIISIDADALVSVRRGNLRLQAGIERMVAHNL